MVGDQIGCGTRLEPTNKKQTVFFTHNGNLVRTDRRIDRTATLRTVIGFSANCKANIENGKILKKNKTETNIFHIIRTKSCSGNLWLNLRLFYLGCFHGYGNNS